MKKLILLLLLVLPLISNSQSNDFNKSQKRNEQFFRNRTFWVPTYYPRLYPNYWYTSPYIVATPYYPVSASSTNLEANISFGLNLPILSTQNKVGFGVYMTFGEDLIFITGLDMLELNKHMYYSNISYRDVLSWGDIYMGEERQSYLINLGLGKRINNIVPYICLSIQTQTNYSIYFDNSYILSNNGYYTIYNGKEIKFGPSFGALYDIKKLQLNLLFVPQRDIISIGAGVRL